MEDLPVAVGKSIDLIPKSMSESPRSSAVSLLPSSTNRSISKTPVQQLYMAIMSTFWFLTAATAEIAAEGGHEGGFGLNSNLLETNLINLVIIIGALFFFGRKILGKTLSERRSKIEEAIRDAQVRQKEAAAAVADAQQKLAQAQAEAEKIRASAEDNAQSARAKILEASRQDIERMKETAIRDLDGERERAIAQLRQQVVAMAMQRVESQLKDRLDESAQHQLVDRSIGLMGGGS